MDILAAYIFLLCSHLESRLNKQNEQSLQKKNTPENTPEITFCH